MALFLRQPLFVQIMAVLYLLWVAAAAVYTFWWALSTSLFTPPEVTNRLAVRSRFWYLNMWSSRTKRLWFAVSMGLALVYCLSLFIQDAAR